MVMKLAATVSVSDEVLRDNFPFTLEGLIAAQERARQARLRRWEGEVIFGAHLNPCIELGEN